MMRQDIPAVRALWREAGLSDEPEDEPEAMAAYLAAPQSAGFVAEAHGSMIGVALCGSDGRYGYIHHLAVRERWRREGIGAALEAACRGHLNCRHVLILVRDQNRGGLDFWRKLGFSRVDGLAVHYRPDERAVTAPNAPAPSNPIIPHAKT